MAYCGRFTERFPEIKAAGKSEFVPNLSVAACLFDTYLEEEINKLSERKDPKPKDYGPPLPPSNVYQGLYTHVRELLCPKLPSRFQCLLTELKETSQRSYWKNEVGKAPDPVSALPVGTDTVNTTFGSPNKAIHKNDLIKCFETDDDEPITVKSLINPDIPPGEHVLLDQMTAQLYQTSHRRTLTGKGYNYRYDNPELSPNLTWGEVKDIDNQGTQVKKALQWFDQSNVSATSKRQANYKLKHHPIMGKTLEPNDNSSRVPPGFAFGRPSQVNQVTVKSILQNCEQSSELQKVVDYLRYVVNIRKALGNKDHPLPFLKISNTLKGLDQDLNGCLPLSKVYEVYKSYGLEFDTSKLEPLLRRAGLLHNEDQVCYRGFYELLNPQYGIPDIGKIQGQEIGLVLFHIALTSHVPDLPEQCLHFSTTYQTLTEDINKKCITDALPRAGLSSLRNQEVKAYMKLTRLDLTELIGETSVDTLIRPSLFTNYGLDHRDFFYPRTKDFIRTLFKEVGVEIPDDIFEMMWKEGIARDKTGEVCIETFRNILDEVTAGKLAQMSSV